MNVKQLQSFTFCNIQDVYQNQFLVMHVEDVVAVICFFRYPDQKFGKWRGAACVVKKAANERPAYPYFVRGPNQAKKNSERLGYLFDLIIEFRTFC